MQNNYFPPTVPMDLIPPAVMKTTQSSQSPYMDVVSDFYVEWQTNGVSATSTVKTGNKTKEGGQLTMFNIF